MAEPRPQEIMERTGGKLIRRAPDADGSVMCTRHALSTVEAALRDLHAARVGLLNRLRLIDRDAA